MLLDSWTIGQALDIIKQQAEEAEEDDPHSTTPLPPFLLDSKLARHVTEFFFLLEFQSNLIKFSL